MQQGYPAVVSQPPTNVVITAVGFGETPMQVTCGNCRQTVITTTTAENGACAWVAALVVCLVFCPCFFLPLCMDSCKDVHHSCPACGARLGSYKRL